MQEKDLFFRSVKESRERYFLEYRPPRPSARFATLQLVFLGQTRTEEIIAGMAAEADHWLTRYPVPVMVSAFDDTGMLMKLEPTRECDHLIALPGRDGRTPQHSWRLLSDEELPEEVEDVEYLKRVYADVPFKAGHQLRVEAEKRAKDLKVGWLIFFIWLVIVPATIAIAGFASLWVGALAMLYSLGKAAVKGLKLTGKWKPSPSEIERQEYERLMRYDHHHCKLNPEGFRGLMIENFEKEEREAIRREAEMLKSAGSIVGEVDANNGVQAGVHTPRR